MREEKRRSRKKKTGIIIGALAVLLVAAGVLYVTLGGNGDLLNSEPEDTRPINPLTGLRVESLPDRAVQFSIDNVQANPQSGLSKADIIYEMPAEGGLTRLEAIFYGEVPDVVGPIRSARPYFVDLAREYNAVFVHHGGSQAALSYLSTGVVDHISPNTNASIFYRASDRISPHDSMVLFGDILDEMEAQGMNDGEMPRTFTFAPEVTEDGNTAEETTGEDDGTAQDPTVTTVTIHNPAELVEHVYDPATNLYQHYVNGELYIDKENQETITAANIIVMYVTSSVLDSKGRLAIDMTAGGDALLFTGGEVVQGTWSRADLDSQTVFTDEEGNEFVLTRGKTFVHVIDQNGSVAY